MNFCLQIYEPCEQCGMPENPYHTANGCLPAVCEFECETCKKQFVTDQYFSVGDDDIPRECPTCFESDEDVCCVGCGERVCGFTEEPPHKDERDEAVCDECWEIKNM